MKKKKKNKKKTHKERQHSGSRLLKFSRLQNRKKKKIKDQNNWVKWYTRKQIPKGDHYHNCFYLAIHCWNLKMSQKKVCVFTFCLMLSQLVSISLIFVTCWFVLWLTGLLFFPLPFIECWTMEIICSWWYRWCYWRSHYLSVWVCQDSSSASR